MQQVLVLSVTSQSPAERVEPASVASGTAAAVSFSVMTKSPHHLPAFPALRTIEPSM